MGARVVSIAEKMALIESLARRVGCPIDLVDLRAAQRGLGVRVGNARRLRLRNGKDGRYATLSVGMSLTAGYLRASHRASRAGAGTGSTES